MADRGIASNKVGTCAWKSKRCVRRYLLVYFHFIAKNLSESSIMNTSYQIISLLDQEFSHRILVYYFEINCSILIFENWLT